MTTLSISERLVKQEVLRETVVEMMASLHRYFNQNNVNEEDTKNPLVILLKDLGDELDKILLADDEQLVKIDGYVNYLYQMLRKIGVI